MNKIRIRLAEPADFGVIAAIYAHSVRTSAATFDLDDPPDSYWQAKLDSTIAGDHFIVACINDEVVGYAYSWMFRPRPAYDRTREMSVYVAPEATGTGIGTQLYIELLDLLRGDNVHLVIAAVTQPNPASNALHRKLGFTEVGTLDEVGFKFGIYISAKWFQMRLD